MSRTTERIFRHPVRGPQFSVTEMVCELEAMIGRKLKEQRFPWWALRLATPVWPLARGLRETCYLWDLDQTLLGNALATLLPDLQKAPLSDVLSSKLPQGSSMSAHTIRWREA